MEKEVSFYAIKTTVGSPVIECINFVKKVS